MNVEMARKNVSDFYFEVELNIKISSEKITLPVVSSWVKVFKKAPIIYRSRNSCV